MRRREQRFRKIFKNKVWKKLNKASAGKDTARYLYIYIYKNENRQIAAIALS